MITRAAAFATLFAVAGLAGLIACSGTAASDSAPNVCSALAACCGSLAGIEATTCQQQAAAVANAPSECNALVQSYTANGLCGPGGPGAKGTPGNGNGPTGGIDAGLPSVPCSITGTCPNDAGSSNTGNPTPGNPTPGNPVSTTCTAFITCANGVLIQTCTTTSPGGSCSAQVAGSDGTKIACASCTDCQAATAQAATLICGVSGPIDAGPPPAPDSGASTCGTTPGLHPELDAGVYCPFTATGAVHCGAGQECCEAPSGNTSTCQAGGTTCPVTGSITWQCQGVADCAGSAAGPQCCAGGTVQMDSTCSYFRGSGFQGLHCATACATGEVPICSMVTDPCAAGTMCTPFKVAGVALGTCL